MAASLLLLSLNAARAEPAKIDTLKDMWARLKQCWQPPRLPQGHPGMQITVLFSFQHNGELLGRPRITFESPEATQAASIAYRAPGTETSHRLPPSPFTPTL